MKILALTILFVLMFFRIKGTPSALSKTLWRKRMIKQLAKNKENNNGKPLSDAMQGGAILIVFLLLFKVDIVCAQTSTLCAFASAEGNKTSLPASFIVNVAVVELVRIVMYLPPMAAPFKAPPEVEKYCFTLSLFI